MKEIKERSHVLDWKYEQRTSAKKALELAKAQNKPIKYLTK
jgi:hypothetical protein